MKKNKLFKENPFLYNIMTAKGDNRKVNNKLFLSAAATVSGGSLVQYHYNNYESLPVKIIIGTSIAIMGSQIIVGLYDNIKMIKSEAALIELEDVLKKEGINIKFSEFMDDKNFAIYNAFNKKEGVVFLVIENGKIMFENDLENKRVFYVDKEKEETKEREITNLIDKAWMLKKVK